MDKKKVVMFIVEGLSDKDALEPIVAELLNNTLVRFEVVRGDITATTNYLLKNMNIRKRVTEVVTSYLENNRGIKKRDIIKIILISDMDGCYINDANIIFSDTDDKFRYEDNGIYTKYPQMAIDRNQIKSNNLDIISSTSGVYNKISIETYYFSCNLDHVLYNIRNLPQNQKETYAQDFSDTLEGEETKFMTFINTSDIAVEKRYSDSWEYIKHDLQSLLRNSNFHLFFKRNRDLLSEDAKKVLDDIENSNIEYKQLCQ